MTRKDDFEQLVYTTFSVIVLLAITSIIVKDLPNSSNLSLVIYFIFAVSSLLIVIALLSRVLKIFKR